MNGTSYVNPRFAQNENAVRVASFNGQNTARMVRVVESRDNIVNRAMDRAMRQNTARFI